MFSEKLHLLTQVLHTVEIRHQNTLISLDEFVDVLISHFDTLLLNHRKLAFIGNGGSAGIASHMAADFTKNGHLRALTFTDASYLTCLSNDFSYQDAYATAISHHLDAGDMLIAISSSGASPNILNAVSQALKQQVTVFTLSGFKPENPLRSLGQFNLYLPSCEYGMVEVGHHIILHHILDRFCNRV